jgi:hypothetical protein
MFMEPKTRQLTRPQAIYASSEVGEFMGQAM